MLCTLHIENVAVIESADVAFDFGLNVLTGETGSGKSIIIDSINAISGARTSRDIIRTGAKNAFISAIFQNISEYAKGVLAQSGIYPDEDGTLLVTRDISLDGRNTCCINGRPAALSQLKTIGDTLIDIHGQHTSRILLETATHLDLLDQVAKNQKEVYRYRENYKALREIEGEISGLALNESDKARRMDMLSYQINEIEQAGLSEGEEEELYAKRKLLSNFERIIAGLSQARELLSGSDYAQGASSQASSAAAELGQLRGFDDRLASLSERLNEAVFLLEDCAGDISSFIEDYDFSPGELNRIEARIDAIYKLKKYGGGTTEILAFLERAQNELNHIRFSDERMEALNARREEFLKKTLESGEELSRTRRAGAEVLKEKILSELEGLDMANVVFDVEFSPREPSSGGLEDIQFLISTNKGEALKPLSKIASGGELSRIMLALLNVLGGEADTLIFDEIDTGVGGRAAQRVGQKLCSLAAGKQVLCVTHLSQIASFADAHFQISKYVEGERTKTNVQKLGKNERMRELARINSGDVITESGLQNASEQLEDASKYKSARSIFRK